MRARALEVRADKALSTADDAAAMADLEQAIRLSPSYPWSRYRLAELYSKHGDAERGRALFREGVLAAAHNPDMNYAQALYLSSIEDYAGALAALESIAQGERSQGMRDLYDRVSVAEARRQARAAYLAGDLEEARAKLLGVESLAHTNLDRARELAFSWIELGDVEHGLGLLEPYVQREPVATEALLSWAQVLNSAEDAQRLQTTLVELRGRSLTEQDRREVARLQRSLDLRVVRNLRREGKLAQAARRLDELLAADPNDRTLRIARADLYLAVGNARAACNLYAALVAEKPDDIDTRLDYVRALTDAGDLALARLQLAAVLERVDENNIDGRLGIARRQLALGDAAQAAATLRPLLAKAPQRADLWYVAGRAELEQHHYAKAREYFAHAEMSENKDDALAARLVREEIDARKQSWMSAGIEYRYKPGDAGISRFDALVIPSYWRFARNYEERVTLHADAVTIDAGTLGRDFDEAALLGTIQAAGPNAVRRHSNDAQKGLSIGVGYETDTLAFDLGTTPLGFLLPNLVGGAEWSPRLKNLDVSLGVSRRAVTSSVLSYAGMRDPITGEKWGGVVETGPYAQLGFYRERYSLSGALKASDLSGTHVLDNTFYGARIASDWKFIAQRHEQAFVGITINYWRYDHDLQNYTFGAGGYYSPKSYLSIGLPLEVQGARGAWSYRVRAAVAHSTSDTDRIAFYPNDPALQAQALASALPSGYSEPYFDGGKSSSTSFSAYGAVERQLFREWVLGAKIDLDRSDYYHPTVFTFYVRHVFDGATTSIAVPPRPARGYN